MVPLTSWLYGSLHLYSRSQSITRALLKEGSASMRWSKNKRNDHGRAHRPSSTAITDDGGGGGGCSGIDSRWNQQNKKQKRKRRGFQSFLTSHLPPQKIGKKKSPTFPGDLFAHSLEIPDTNYRRQSFFFLLYIYIY